MNRRLYRSTKNRVFGGVCSGLAAYTNIDIWLLRLLAAMAILATNVIPGLIAYGVCCLIIPTEYELREAMNNPGFNDKNPPNPEKTRMIIGVVLIIVGVLTLVKLLFGWFDFRYLLPVVLVVAGSYLIYKNWGHQQ
ncbi:MAG: PspC domain-containing protein [Clostridiaceae bacterium]|jgi:phage shock protein C|nr:PspC domain-containing protein [Clostridiaceae bacterium]